MLKVFISHSAVGDIDPEAAELLDALATALKDDFAVRYDRKDLQLGVNWRSTINYWVNHCDAAVVLLSRKALRSSYVAYEVALLTARKKVTIIPVFLGDVDYSAVDQSPLSPSKIQDIESVVNEPDQARRVERVKAALLEADQGLAPVNRQAELLAECLRGVGVNEVRRQLERLEPNRDAWMEDADPHLSLAVRMMSTGIDRATAVIIEFLDVLKRNDKLHEVFELVATSWVDTRAVEYVKEVAAGAQVKRALATNGAKPLIAKIYIWCASERTLASSWTVVESSGIFTEDAFGELKAEIEAALVDKLSLLPEDVLADELDFLDRKGEPVFVTLPAAGVSQAVLEKLRDAFKTVTFFLRAGCVCGDGDPVEGEVKFIRPPLEGDFEEKFCELYNTNKKYLNRMAGRR